MGRILPLWLTVTLLGTPLARAQNFDLFTPQQDIEMGKQAQAEIERTRPVLHDDALTAYLTRIGNRLAQSHHAGEFAFRFYVINDKAVNSFSFPGGPIYIDTGLLAMVGSETELAAVLAHEMSHIALRHGTHQATKAMLVQAPAAFVGGMIGDDSMMAKLAHYGITYGAKSVLLHYSREYENAADLNGARIMNDAGYNPQGMVRFFEDLNEQGTQASGRLQVFFSDHPAAANRVEAVKSEIRLLPKEPYRESDPRGFARVKRIVAQLPPPPPPAGASN